MPLFVCFIQKFEYYFVLPFITAPITYKWNNHIYIFTNINMRIFQQVAATGKHFYSTLYESDFLPLVQTWPHAIIL